jgi:dolichyl-phosphate beta-glucosyltransferase
MSPNLKRNEFISVVIPAYNESRRISATLERMYAYFKDHSWEFEIIVVDDGGTDDTKTVVQQIQNRLPLIKCLSSPPPNRGKGHAVRQGVAASLGEIVLISDADLSTPVEDIEKLLLHLDQGYDVIIGSRGLKDSDVRVRQPFFRIAMGKTFNRLVRLMVLEDFRDTQCGFKLFRGACAREIFKHSTIKRFAFDVEILFLAKKQGYKIKEVPITWLNSPDSKVHPIRDSFQMLTDIFRLWFRNL